MLYVFLSKPFKEWNFVKFQVTFLAQFFFSQKSIVFKWKQIKFEIFLNFYFASSDSVKAVTGCFEKLEFSKQPKIFKATKATFFSTTNDVKLNC